MAQILQLTGKLSYATVGSEPVLESLYADTNGSYTPEAGVDGFSEVMVDVNNPPNVGPLNVAVNGTYTAADEGLDGYDVVYVEVQAGGGTSIDGLISGSYNNEEIETRAQEVRSYAFYNVTGVEKLTFTEPVLSIAANAFTNFDTADHSVHFRAINPPVFDPDSFANSTIQSVTVPAAAFDLYDAAIQDASLMLVVIEEQ